MTRDVHRRRRLVALAPALAIVVSACGGGSTRSTSTAVGAARSAPAPAVLAPGSRLLLHAAEPLSSAYVAAGSLYFSDARPVGEHVGENYEMTSVRTSSGVVTARRWFANTPVATIRAGGSLWVTTSGGGRVTLWRLNPRSLAVRSSRTLPSSPRNQGIAGSMAVAGSRLWVGTGLLDGVSLRTGRLDRVVSPSRPGPVQLEADPTGRSLLASEGYQHPIDIVRLDPDTARPMSEVAVSRSNSQPSFGGIADGTAWIENVVGSRTSVWRIRLSTMTVSAWPLPAPRSTVRLIAGILWVTEPVGESNLNYCADPVTGRALSRLPLLPGNSTFLTADRTAFFYTDVPVNAHAVKLESAPISPRCAR